MTLLEGSYHLRNDCYETEWGYLIERHNATNTRPLMCHSDSYQPTVLA